MRETAETERPREVVPVHYGNLYAAVVEYVAHHGPCTGPEIAAAVDCSYETLRTYLSRAVRRGHWHRVCFSCGQALRPPSQAGAPDA